MCLRPRRCAAGGKQGTRPWPQRTSTSLELAKPGGSGQEAGPGGDAGGRRLGVGPRRRAGSSLRSMGHCGLWHAGLRPSSAVGLSTPWTLADTWVSGPLALNRGGGGACALSAGRRTTAGRTPSLPEAGVKQRRSSVASSPPPLPASPQGPSSEKRGGLGGAAAPAGNSHSAAREAPPVSIATCREEFPGLQTLSQ